MKRTLLQRCLPTALWEHLASSPTLRALVLLALGCLLLLSFFLSIREIYSVDIGLHLAAGRWIVTHASFPVNDPFTYTVAHHEYIDLYWLYQLLLVFLNWSGGSLALVLVNGLLITCSLYMIFYRAHEKAVPPLLVSFLLLTTIVLSMNYEIRPHVLSWLYLNLLLLALDRLQRDERRSFVAPLVIMVLWVNTQPTFVLGWVAIASHWAAITIARRTVAHRATLYSALAVAVCLLNPYGVKGILLPFTQYGFLQESSIFKNLIAEYRPLPFFPSAEDYTTFGKLDLLKPLFLVQILRIMFIILCAVQLARKRLSVSDSLLFVLFLYVSSLAEKNIGYFIVAVSPMLLSSFGVRRSAGSEESAAHKRSTRNVFLTAVVGRVQTETATKWVSLGFIVLCVYLIPRVVTDDYYATLKVNHRFGYRPNNLVLPVKATDFLRQHRLEGKMMNHLNFGGYFMDKLPQKIFVDGRNEVMGAEFARVYAKTTSNVGIVDVVHEYDPEIAAFPHKEGLSWLNYFLHDTTGWRLVYFDELAAIYLRKGYAEEVPTIEPAIFFANHPVVTREESYALLAKKFKRGPFDGLMHQQYYPIEESELSVFCYYQQWHPAAISVALQGIERSTVECPGLFFNLGVFFYNAKDLTRAGLCFRWLLEEGYSHPGIEQYVRAIQEAGAW